MPNPASSGTGFLDVSSWLQMLRGDRGLEVHGRAPPEHGRVHPFRIQAVHDGRRRRVSRRRVLRVPRRPAQEAGRADRHHLPGGEARAGTWRRPRIVKGTKNLDAARTLVDWSVSEKAMKLYNEGYAVVAISAMSQPVEHLPGNMLEHMAKNDFAVGGHRTASAILDEWAEALRREVGAQEVADRERGRGSSAPYLRDPGRLTKKFGAFTAARRHLARDHRGRVRLLPRPLGLRQDHAAPGHRRARHPDDRPDRAGGRDISALPPSKRDFGIVFQSYALFPNLTAAQNVAYGLENARMPRARGRAGASRSCSTWSDWPSTATKYPAQLSGGQQQRVALARALATSPGLLLLDEPLSALDAKVRVHLRHEIKQLQRRLGVTTIMVTHDQEEALTMADRIVVMNLGAIEQVGTPLEIYREPASPFVADFIGVDELRGRHRRARQARCGSGAPSSPATPTASPPGTDVTLAIRPEDIAGRRRRAERRRTPSRRRWTRWRFSARSSAPTSSATRPPGCSCAPTFRPIWSAVAGIAERAVLLSARCRRSGSGSTPGARQSLTRAAAARITSPRSSGPRSRRDDRLMRALHRASSALYLVVALALPLGLMLAKSLRDRRTNSSASPTTSRYFSTPALFQSIGNSLLGLVPQHRHHGAARRSSTPTRSRAPACRLRGPLQDGGAHSDSRSFAPARPRRSSTCSATRA